ncbi:IS3 family transposase [Brevibacillus thermoruber]|uniref:IS3 family transposase n=1 Tax=Brevibacillus thermoruber TaxID=33942 RepID=UPI003A5BD344
MPKAKSIYFYNHDRSQRKRNKLTPVEHRRQHAAWVFFSVSATWGLPVIFHKKT